MALVSPLLLIVVLALPSQAAAAAALDLGTAGTYSVLAGSTVTNTGLTDLAGDLGVSPGTAITGFPPGVTQGAVHAGDASAAQAQVDLGVAYDAAAARTGATDVGAALTTGTLTPGVYNAAAALDLSGVLTLDGLGNPNAEFIFQVGTALTTASATRISLVNGASACNVYWQVGSSATLGTATSFQGSIMAMQSITMTAGAALDGRALARVAAVTLDTNTITNPVCAAAPSPSVTTTVTETVTAPPVTQTVTAPALTETVTAPPVTETVTAAPVTQTITAPGGTETVTAPPITETVTAPPVTQTVTEIAPAPTTTETITQTVTAAPGTQIVTAPPGTETVTAPPDTQTVTQTVPAPTATETVTQTVTQTESAPTVTETATQTVTQNVLGPTMTETVTDTVTAPPGTPGVSVPAESSTADGVPSRFRKSIPPPSDSSTEPGATRNASSPVSIASVTESQSTRPASPTSRTSPANGVSASAGPSSPAHLGHAVRTIFSSHTDTLANTGVSPMLRSLLGLGALLPMLGTAVLLAVRRSRLRTASGSAPTRPKPHTHRRR